MSATSRVFRGCRALLEAAKAGTGTSKPSASTSKKTTTTKSKPKPKPRSKSPVSPPKPRPPPTRPTGIMKSAPLSPALGSFLGVHETSRSDAVKKIWDYIKLHNLQNPTNKKEIYCDAKLKTIFEGRDKVGFLEIGKLLSPHFVKTN
ncbi:unnamed protein product [Ilex paraguariensis]|uniref:DM2 domain-containing protein n=1 Tax=Ilex paraguariensis TaxID=185542 RepID=A0ABC8RQ62_9AQUA